MEASRPHIAYVDTIDTCHLRCPSCHKGVRTIPNTTRKMPLEMFERIVNKLKAAGYQIVSLYNWTEPFLNRQLPDFVALTKRAGLGCELSTTLSLRRVDSLEAVLQAGLDRMRVSMSGLEQEIYQINHVGGVVSDVLSNLRRMRALLDQHALAPEVLIKMIRFDYNSDEEPKLRALADELRFGFELTEGMSNPSNDQRLHKTTEVEFERYFTTSWRGDTPESRGELCPLLFDQIVIDVVGDVYLCCAFPTYPSLRIGNYLELTDQEILLRRYAHPLCRVCYMPRRPASAADGERLAGAMRDRFPAAPPDMPAVAASVGASVSAEELDARVAAGPIAPETPPAPPRKWWRLGVA